MFGKLSLSSIPFDQPIIMIAGIFMVIGGVSLFALITYLKRWKWLWTEWFTTVDHKKIGIMYILVALVMLVRGFTDAIMMRAQQAMAVASATGYLPPEHYDQIFTAHGVIMIFFVAMPFMFGLMNIAIPLQIGARDVAFPYLNALSFWLFVAGAVLVQLSLIVGKFAATGWLAYPPLSGIAYSPGVGVDYYIWALQISGLGSLLSGINFFVTIMKMRCPGMTLMKMPVFTWSVLSSSILIIIVFPVLTVTLALLFLDRFMGMHFFTASFGGNQMLYVNLIWAWGHPEVYILVLPAFGILSEVVATFCQKRLFGYKTMVYAIAAITFLSFIVWLHHFFTMGAGANVNAFFGIATMIISIPTGVKVFNWLFTMYRGRIIFSTPILWTIGFLTTFTVGGMTGVLLSIPAADFQLHNSLFLVAHFHNTIIGGVLFGYFAAFTYWFPKAVGFTLNEKLGKCAFWCWIVGFYLAFMPLYILGFMGMTRRMNHYPVEAHPYLVVALIGALFIAAGIGFQVLQIIVSIIQRKKNMDTTGDPWNARTLEWSIPSPPAFYNFAHVPNVEHLDAFWEEKQKNSTAIEKEYEDIHMPKNSALPIIIAGLSFLAGFALIWHILWMGLIGIIGIFVCVLLRAFDYNFDYYIKKDEVAATEAAMSRIQ
jgi:cytochrome o ubiquinol oxidase subunit 1